MVTLLVFSNLDSKRVSPEWDGYHTTIKRWMITKLLFVIISLPIRIAFLVAIFWVRDTLMRGCAQCASARKSASIRVSWTFNGFLRGGGWAVFWGIKFFLTLSLSMNCSNYFPYGSPSTIFFSAVFNVQEHFLVIAQRSTPTSSKKNNGPYLTKSGHF